MIRFPYGLSDRVEGVRSTAAGKRPKLSLASLIGQAILSSQGRKARLSTIYEWIAQRYPEYYRLNNGGWQNSIRHNLTINKAFVRVPKGESDAPGKGAFWTIHLDHVQDFQDGVFVGKVRGSDYRSHAKLRLNEMDDEALMSRPETFRSLNEEHEYQLSNASRSHSDLHMPHDSINDASAYQPVYGGDEKTAFGYHGPPPMSRHPNYYYYGTNGQYYYNYVAPSATMGWQNQTPHQHGACSCSSCTNAPPTAEEDEDHAPHPCSLNQLQFQPFSFSSGAAATEQEESEMEKSYHNLAIDGSKEDMNRA